VLSFSVSSRKFFFNLKVDGFSIIENQWFMHHVRKMEGKFIKRMEKKIIQNYIQVYKQLVF